MRREGYATQGDSGEARRSESGVPVWGRLSVWIPRIRVRESRDVTVYEGTAPMLPGDRSVAEVQDVN